MEKKKKISLKKKLFAVFAAGTMIGAGAVAIAGKVNYDDAGHYFKEGGKKIVNWLFYVDSNNTYTPPIDENQTDADRDGLKDWWEEKYFGNLSQGAYDDPDKDYVANIHESRKIQTPRKFTRLKA